MFYKPEWVFPGQSVEKTAERLIHERPMPKFFARILANRGLRTFAEAEAFVTPSLDNLHDPFLFKDMHVAVDRLKKGS